MSPPDGVEVPAGRDKTGQVFEAIAALQDHDEELRWAPGEQRVHGGGALGEFLRWKGEYFNFRW